MNRKEQINNLAADIYSLIRSSAMSRALAELLVDKGYSKASEMNRDKQIEEKKKVIGDICPLYKEYDTCEQCNTELDVDDEPCYWECMANCIIRNNYRKASEVAEELINMALSKVQIMISAIKSQEENGSITEFNGGAKTALEIVFKDLAELKKKYTEGTR